MSASTPPDVSCHVCGVARLELDPAFPAFHRVTSDCKPWPAGGILARCPACGMVQSPITPAWRADADRIYAGYTIYHQSGGAEQQVFQAGSGAGQPRSDLIVRRLADTVDLPTHGRLLDVGCGNGAFLSAWSRQHPGWALLGTEVSDTYRANVEAIPGVERLHTGALDALPGGFDVISLIHVFEHIPDPLSFLRGVWRQLAPGGLLLIEVPDCAENPFMLLVADHCSHFSPPLLAGVIEAAGFVDVHAADRWVAKEVSLVARRGPHEPAPRAPSLPRDASDLVFQCSATLGQIVHQVAPLTRRPAFGLFGTAIAATWLDAQTSGAARFFVDEDPHRIGRTHLGRPIVAPAEVPRGATVFVALPGRLAGTVAQRLHQTGRELEVVLP